jgi:hypothetical protein
MDSKLSFKLFGLVDPGLKFLIGVVSCGSIFVMAVTKTIANNRYYLHFDFMDSFPRSISLWEENRLAEDGSRKR